MRPKASSEYLHIASAFANAVTLQSEEKRVPEAKYMVHCRGPRSIFAALSQCIPSITRDGNAGRSLKGAISEAELNKFLSRLGFQVHRHRERNYNAKLHFHEIRIWNLKRWADPSNAEELQQLRSQLSSIPARFPGNYFICESKLLEFLESIFSVDTSVHCQDETWDESDLWTYTKSSEMTGAEVDADELSLPGYTRADAVTSQRADAASCSTMVPAQRFTQAIPCLRLTSKYR